MQTDAAVQNVRTRLRTAGAIAVLTGAGISADSGVPTFRGADGLWRTFRAEDLATPEAFARDPTLVWEWYNWRRECLATKRPNAAHEALATLEEECKRFWLITQNVDGLHRAAGSRRLSEIHGNIWKVRCTECGLVGDNHDVPIAIPPRCSTCRGLLRPHIVWFGEAVGEDDLRRSRDAVQSCDILVIIGTSGVVYPAATFASVAREAGAFVVEINPAPTSNSCVVNLTLRGRASEMVPRLLS